MSVVRQNETSHLSIGDAVAVYASAIKSAYNGIVALFTVFAERRKSRQYLASMDYRMLDDIGVSYFEARAEAEKPFWKA